MTASLLVGLWRHGVILWCHTCHNGIYGHHCPHRFIPPWVIRIDRTCLVCAAVSRHISNTMLPKAVETFRFPSIYDDYDFCTRYGISRRAVPYFSFKEVSCPDRMTRWLSHELHLMISDRSSYLAENNFTTFTDNRWAHNHKFVVSDTN